MAVDLHVAWTKSNATALAVVDPSGGTDHLDWVGLTEGDVRNILSMPDKAHREVSKSVSLSAENRFVLRVRNPHLGGSEQWYRNWCAEWGHQHVAWVQVVHVP